MYVCVALSTLWGGCSCQPVQPIILRAYSLYALAKALSTAKRAVTDSVAKDIIKHSKNALSDKALPVQRAACEVRHRPVGSFSAF